MEEYGASTSEVGSSNLSRRAIFEEFMRTIYFLDEAVAAFTAQDIYQKKYQVKWNKNEPKKIQTSMPNEQFRARMQEILVYGYKREDWQTMSDFV